MKRFKRERKQINSYISSRLFDLTFNLHNFNDRYAIGSNIYIAESLPIPTHYHTFNIGNGEDVASAPDLGIPAGGTFNTNDATGFSAPYSSGAKVRPDSLTVLYCIKY